MYACPVHTDAAKKIASASQGFFHLICNRSVLPVFAQCGHKAACFQVSMRCINGHSTFTQYCDGILLYSHGSAGTENFSLFRYEQLNHY